MAKRTSLLGRSRPSEKLTGDEIAVLDKVALPPGPPAKPPENRGSGLKLKVRKDLLKFRWSLECPGCGFRSPAMANPNSDNVWRGAAAANWSSSCAAGDGSDNNCALFPRKRADNPKTGILANQ